MFEQTARMFQNSPKGTLIYDVLDDRVANGLLGYDG